MQLWGEGVQQGKGVQAIPFAPPPASLPSDMVGYVGFDPLGVSTLCDIKFLREAELKHSRVAMLAAAGSIAQDLFHFPVNALLPTPGPASHPAVSVCWRAVGGVEEIFSPVLLGLSTDDSVVRERLEKQREPWATNEEAMRSVHGRR